MRLPLDDRATSATTRFLAGVHSHPDLEQWYPDVDWESKEAISMDQVRSQFLEEMRAGVFVCLVPAFKELCRREIRVVHAANPLAPCLSLDTDIPNTIQYWQFLEAVHSHPDLEQWYPDVD
jgi:hypothetical protein